MYSPSEKQKENRESAINIGYKYILTHHTCLLLNDEIKAVINNTIGYTNATKNDIPLIISNVFAIMILRLPV
jgi:hypothetical protein